MTSQASFHIVKDRDTLGKIARANGTTVAELIKINGIKDPRKLAVGQRIALRREAVCGIRALFLDRDRNSIADLTYRIDYCGKTLTAKTGESGMTKPLLTDTPDDPVTIWVQRLDGSWKHVTTVVSGFGNKLVTLVSAHLAVKARAEEHPVSADKKRPDPKEKPKPVHDPAKALPPTTGKKNLGLKATPGKTADGKPLTIVEGDLFGLDEFLEPFNGEVMNDADYAWAAKELGVEEAAIRAYATVESGKDKGAGFIEIGTRKVPAILYERHKFSAHTKHQYSAKYPDISLPVGYYVKTARYVAADDAYKKRRGVPADVAYYRQLNKKDDEETKNKSVTLGNLLESGMATTERDTYLRNAANYKRLARAYQLDKIAALKSCSWGAFQIMGEYWDTMGYSSVFEFTKAMSRSEKEQIKAFVRYIKYVNPAIVKYLNAHEWARAAEAYNGPSYKQNRYDTKLADEYKKFKEME